MALFRRNKTDDAAVMPEEVNSYYQAENRERTWMAWLLALVTLAVTAIIIIGLFFGGRWVYRKFRHNPKTTTAVVTQKPSESTPTNTQTPETPVQTQNSTPSSGSTAQPSTTGTVNAPANPASGSNAAGTSGSTPAASTTTPSPAANSNLPNTGPGDILSIFAVVSIAAYVLHRRLQS